MQIDALGPSDFRTRAALAKTMGHLREIMDRSTPSFAKIHNFLFDRYRSVRQDLYVQGIEVGRAQCSANRSESRSGNRQN